MPARILVVADVRGWAWERKAQAYQQHLTGARYTVQVAYQTEGLPDFTGYDLVHLFEVSQTGHLAGYPGRPYRSFKVVAGITANVWRTWGAPQMHEWASRVDALHANSCLLEQEMRPFHPRVFYTPNGVDPAFFRRFHRIPTRPPVFGHVGKPNPRKGGALIIEAARKAEVELRVVQRTSKLAMPAEKMLGWYQGVSVMVCASNMDGTPNPMLEGAACECSLLSTPIGNMPEFIRNGHNGWLLTQTLPYHGPVPDGGWPPDVLVADAQQTDQLRDALVERLRWYKDHPAEVLGMGQRARETVLAGWTWATQVQHVAAMWDQVLAA